MEGKHLVVSCTLASNNSSFPSFALVDSGATGFGFIDGNFVRHQNISQLPLLNPRSLEVIDGRPINSGTITHYVEIPMRIGTHEEKARLFVTQLGHYPIVLGIPWLRRHHVRTDWKMNTLTFDSPFCLRRCTSNHAPWTQSGITSSLPEHPNIFTLDSAEFTDLVKNEGLQIFSISPMTEVTRSTATREHVPEPYWEFLDIFGKEEASVLPPHRAIDHEIPLKPGEQPPWKPLYGMSESELTSLKDFIKENLANDFIRPSSSPARAPVLFVKKKDGSLRLCVDYRGLNDITVKNRYPLPLIQETLDRVGKAKIYTKLDLRGAYNLLRIKAGEEWKTAFGTRYGHYEFQVMPFGLTNAPATFQNFMNDLLRDYLDEFCSVYLDDILIYSEDLEQHREHVKQILRTLRDNNLFCKPEKCQFEVEEVEYLGFIISPNGIGMDPGKLRAVAEWPTPRNLRDIQSFLGFANFYRRFIQGYSKVVAPLTRLTGKDVPFDWGQDQESAFKGLKSAFTTAPLLAHFDFKRPSIIETDASDFVCAAVLSQKGDDDRLHPVAYFSKKMTPAQCNYPIYDKELLSVVLSLEEWRQYLESAQFEITVLTDHKNLEYFMSTKMLNRRQARWAELLSRFDFKMTFRPGIRGGKPDSLTRRSGDLPEEGDERLTHQFQTLLDPGKLTLAATFSPPDDFLTALEEAYAVDPLPARIIGQIAEGARHSREISLPDCRIHEGRLYFRDRLYVPNHDPLRLKLLHTHHDAPSAGHPGRTKTFNLLATNYFWPGMRKYVERYVRHCHTCSRVKSSRHAPYGNLLPLSVPNRPWNDVSMDFITGLPESGGHNAILVVVDRLTKMSHFIPCRDTCTAEDVAFLFRDHIWKLHGLPESIVSDRGSVFVSELWRNLCKELGIHSKLSTAFHPETDGQTERTNAILEQYLRAYINYQQDDWSSWLSQAEFANNAHTSETTSTSPFFANYGYHPRLEIGLPGPTANAPPLDFIDMMRELHETLRQEMRYAQEIQQEQADQHRVPAPALQVGDKVWLSTKNIRTTRPSKKLDQRRMGPFPVSAIIGPRAYRLTLPGNLKIHPVFHVNLLELAARDDPIPGHVAPEPPPVEIEGSPEWEVSEVIDSRRYRRQLQYLVRWTGYAEPTWQPHYDLENAKDKVKVFHETHPEKPRPASLAGARP
jgi:transposase InsO family protein